MTVEDAEDAVIFNIAGQIVDQCRADVLQQNLVISHQIRHDDRTFDGIGSDQFFFQFRVIENRIFNAHFNDSHIHGGFQNPADRGLADAFFSGDFQLRII